MYAQEKRLFIIKILIIILSIVIIYGNDIIIVLNEAIKSEINSYMLIIPFLVGYLLYRVRDVIYASFIFDDITGTDLIIKDILGSLLCIFAYLLKWYGVYKFQTIEIHIISIPIFIFGISLIVFNYDTVKTILGPTFFLFLLVPPPIENITSIGSMLSEYTSQISYEVLKILQQPVSLNLYSDTPYITLINNNQITNFVIDIACSGLYSLIGFIVFSIFLSYISTGNILKRISLFFIGFVLIYSLNIFRIIMLIIIGRYLGQDLALNIFHLFGGWILIFIGSMMLIFINNKITTQNIDENSSFKIEVYEYLKSRRKKINNLNRIKILVLLFFILSTSLLQVPVIAVTKGASGVFIEDELNLDVKTILPEIDTYEAQFIYRDQEFEELVGQDASLWFLYTPINHTALPVWVGIEIGPTKSCLHPWEVCLIESRYRKGQTPSVIEIDRRDIQLLDNPLITARYFVFHSEKDDRTQVTLYWYTQSTFQIDQEYVKKWAKISLISYLDSPENYYEVENYLFPFSEEIVHHWYPISEWSDFVSAFSYEGIVSLLYLDFLVILFVLALLYYNRILVTRKSRLLYKRLESSKDAALFKTINYLGNKKATLDNIALQYNSENDVNLSIDEVYDKLFIAEKNGILNRILFNDNGNPNYYWKIVHYSFNNLYNEIMRLRAVFQNQIKNKEF